MKNTLILGAALLLLFACGGEKETQTETAKTIELVPQLNSLTQLKASDYFDRIEYVALETTDSSLIGPNPQISLLSSGDIMVQSNQRCLLFDRKTGRFLRSIGHRYNDPEGFRNADGWEKANTGILYFSGWKKNYVKYNTDGKFLGSTPSVPYNNSFTPTYLNQDTLIGYYPNMIGGEKRRLLFFSDTSDSLTVIPNLQEAPSFEIENISVLKSEKAVEAYGKYARSGVLVIKGRDELSSVIYVNAPVIWHQGDKTYFKEEFNDTIYHIRGTELIPRYIFNTGEYQWPYSQRYNQELGKEKITIQQVMEGGRYLFFNLSFQQKALSGTFDKETGTTALAKASDLIADDVTGFMPLEPLVSASSGELTGYLEAANILEWFEENGKDTSALSSQIASFAKMKEDDNPVVVIMHPKQ